MLNDMQILEGTFNPFATKRPVYITMGMFDGVHLGHLALIRQLTYHCRARGAFSAVLTFDRHPRGVVIKSPPPPLITPLEQRIYLLSRLGIEGIVVMPFTREVAAIPAADFVREVLVNNLKVKGVLLGFNNKFGAGGQGDYSLLVNLGKELGLDIGKGPEVIVGNRILSSTRIRDAIQEGRLALAENLLGRKFSIFGRVEKGEGVGHRLGFPTANIHPLHSLIPPNGVYASITRVGCRFFPSATFIDCGKSGDLKGVKGNLVESHLIGLKEDIYGKEIEVILLEYFRSQRPFDHESDLRNAIAADVRRAYIVACEVKI